MDGKPPLAQQWDMAEQAQDPDWKTTQAAALGTAAPPADQKPMALLPPEPVPGPRRERPIVLILLAVAVITLFAMGVRSCSQRKARIVAEATARAQEEAARNEQLLIEEQQRIVAEQQRARQAIEERREAARLKAAREKDQKEEAARRAEAAEAERKEQAWAKFYRKPASCNDAGTMNCANDYIRAKQEFERRYARGEL